MPKPRKLTPLEEQVVYDMRKKGIPITEIAYKHGVSTRTIERTVKRIEEEKERSLTDV